MSTNIYDLTINGIKKVTPLIPALESFSRSSGVGGANIKNVYPNVRLLDKKRYIQMSVFDTSKGDPNKLIAQLGGKVSDFAKKAFDWDQKTIKEPVTKPDDKGILDSAKDAWEGLKGIGDSENPFGNPALAEEYVEELWLPLPNELSESLQHTWGDAEGWVQQITQPIGEVTKKAAAVSNWVGRAKGTQALLYNANKVASFEGTAFRSITLTWDLIANSQQEALSIQNIILKLKAYSSPQAIAGKMLLRAPFFFRLHFDNKQLEQQLQFKETVITDVAVNYASSGYMETFIDNMPKTINLSVTFQDREPKTMQAWAKGNELAQGY